ncbi:virulence-associated E family protein [Nitrosomonas sp. Is79A3]|uniref:VapE domain-containing protein n=1 Tax=Nitrosomonas sp. (strain Is79A3) TaxID=261292 RepID=UPI000215CA32
MSPRRQPIDFQLIAATALASARHLLADWVPGGEWSGDEYKPRNPTRDDKHPGSFVINAKTGKWIDNATGDAGGDLVSLYAYVHFIDQVEAAKIVADLVGVHLSKGERKPEPGVVNNPPPQVSDHRKSPWVPIMPAPDDAPVPPVAHFTRGKPDVVYTYYQDCADERVNGYVYRFTTSDGGKETLPVCFCRNRDDGKQEWRWIGFPEPRPLYPVQAFYPDDDTPILLVEGEKCADAAIRYLSLEFDVVTWPGGTKAVRKVDWSPLVGRKIYAWADCDAQRRKLTKEEREAGVDPNSVPLLPESDQPGMRAMREIHKILLELNPDVYFQFVDIPKPGDKPGGWDIADAITEGMDAEALVKFIKNVRKAPSKIKERGTVNRNDGGLLLNKDYKIVPCLANIYDILRSDKRWNGVLAFNEFAYTINKLKAPPFDHGAVGEWEANDDVQASMWLTREYGFAPTPAQVGEAVEALARAHGFHPVRNYLKSLKWDGVQRGDYWISDFIGAPRSPYVMRVSRWFLMGMVARVMEPGVKFDCCLVLEGTQGRRKSAMLRVLAGEWFGDTDLDLNNKDSMGSIRGKWLYEFAELDSIARAEATRQKSFLSRQIDEYRPPYGRRDIRSPRQLVFGGSTNVNWGWNKDETGGRRFWPIECAYDIDCDGLAAVRDQLFAEAYELYKQGKRFWPTSEEQKRIFDPEQLKRHQSDSYVELLAGFVKQQVSDFRMIDAVDFMKIDAARLTRDIQTRVGKSLIILGCKRIEKRSNLIRFWYQPPGTPGGTGDRDGQIEGDSDGISF